MGDGSNYDGDEGGAVLAPMRRAGTQLALPTSSDRNDWTPEQSAMVEAAGLVHVDGQSGTKTLAPRPVVAAFLQHCHRTGLDPIARQLYCIARKQRGDLKWQTQISIDGARLVAERSGQYEGQTTPQFTGDGSTWTDVWLEPTPPRAARVGVYRRGFREPLYAVALWDAYVQTSYNGQVTAMWAKMGPLMLAKCAEMLALRKAFPQDLSGLYSSEEMDQASRGQEAAQAPQVAAQPLEEAQVVEEAAAPEVDVEAVRRFVGFVRAQQDMQQLRAMYHYASQQGWLQLEVEAGQTVEHVLFHRRGELEGGAEVADEVTGEVVEPEPEPESVPQALDVDGAADHEAAAQLRRAERAHDREHGRAG